MTTCIIFGGAGFIGAHLARRLLATGRFEQIHLADLRPNPLPDLPGISASVTDVRRPIPTDLTPEAPAWIFNLAAVHREPGHEASEYFDTNLAGAREVIAYAKAVGCPNLYFTSLWPHRWADPTRGREPRRPARSIAVYGPTDGPTDESAPICPVSPYGASKYPAELMHAHWQAAAPGRRLIICRPGVIYGPGDPGNILRMIRAIKRGYFAYPGSPDIHKSYGYIEGLLDSIAFLMDRDDALIRYNYVEDPTEPLGALVDHVKAHLGSRAPVIPLPLPLLIPAAGLINAALGGNSPIHPMRVRKAARPTHIVPATLKTLNFPFRFDFRSSLVDWQRQAPQDFA